MASNAVITVSKVRKNFKLPHEASGSIKSALINFYKRKKSYETQEVLKDISFEINEGDFFAIVGRNGSGKSTLLKLLAGIYTPSRGYIQVNGKLTPFIELGVGFNPELSGRENVYLNGALLGFSRKEMNAMYEDIVVFAELDRFMDQKLKNYSSGMQVRLAFSIAIRARTDILLLDEVLAVGDAAFQQKCFDYFEQLKKDKKTVVFVTHDMSAIRRFCNRAIYVKGGVLMREGTPVEIADIYLEENMKDEPAATKAENDPLKNLSKNNKVDIKILDQTASKVTIEIPYSSLGDDLMYVGISVIKDGVSIAEITTSLTKPLQYKGKLQLDIDTTIFNAGAYTITSALFKLENRELIAACKSKATFIIKGDDITKGAALKLEDTWAYHEA